MLHFYRLPIALFEFGSLPMLGWLAAAVLPWLIHRWHRAHHRTTPWAAVELLLAAMQQRSRRVNLQQWLLLAVRTAILVLVALAAAEPMWRPWATVDSSPVHHILIVDQSYSMSCHNHEASRLRRAITQARRIIETSPTSDAFTILSWKKKTDNVLGRPTFDRSLALSAIDGLKQSHASVDLPIALRGAAAAIDRAEQQLPPMRHQVVFLSDMARNTWQTDEAQQPLIDRLVQRAELVVVDVVVNVGDRQRDNVAVTELTIDPPAPLRQREATISAVVRSFGERDWKGLELQWIVDGRTIDSQPIDVPATGETAVYLTHRFVEEGPHTVQLTLVGQPDSLPLDDRRWLVTDVRSQLRVACIAGRPRAADDVARALSFADGAIDPEVIPVGRLATLALADYDALLLVDVARLTDREMRQILRYVRGGGGLALLLGEQAGDMRLGQVAPGRMPGLWGGVVGARVSVGRYRFDPLQYEHPIIKPFEGRERSGLLSVEISQYVRIQLRPDCETAEVVLAFDTGDPALVVDRLGLGRVAIAAIPCSLAARTASGAPWSSLAVSPAFVPLVRELVNYLIGDSWLEQRNLHVNQPAVAALRESDAAAEITVRLPTGVRRALPPSGAEDRGQLIFVGTDKIGLYSIEVAGNVLARFAVNLDNRDSDLATVVDAELPAGLNASSTNDDHNFAGVNSSVSFARDLLMIAAALLLFELTLAWLLGKGWG